MRDCRLYLRGVGLGVGPSGRAAPAAFAVSGVIMLGRPMAAFASPSIMCTKRSPAAPAQAHRWISAFDKMDFNECSLTPLINRACWTSMQLMPLVSLGCIEKRWNTVLVYKLKAAARKCLEGRALKPDSSAHGTAEASCRMVRNETTRRATIICHRYLTRAVKCLSILLRCVALQRGHWQCPVISRSCCLRLPALMHCTKG